MSFAHIKKLLASEKAETLKFTGDYFPNELLLLIALQMSVFDVPTLTVVCWFLARAKNKLWKHHADRLYGKHPEFQLVEQQIKNEYEEMGKKFGSTIRYEDQKYDLFFRMYKLTTFPAGRRALQISEGRLEALIDENENGIPYRMKENRIIPLTIIELFNCKDAFIYKNKKFSAFGGFLNAIGYERSKACALDDSLFALAHSLPVKLSKALLDYLYDSVKDKYDDHPLAFEHLKYYSSERAHTILRKSFQLPDLTLKLYLDLKKHLSVHDTAPQSAAIRECNFALISLLLKCGEKLSDEDQKKILAEANEADKWPCEMRRFEEDNLLRGYQHYLSELDKPNPSSLSLKYNMRL